MFPQPGHSLCPAASPCTRLSRALSTTGGPDFHRDLCRPVDAPFSWHTRSGSPDQDRRGSPRSLDTSLSARAVLSDPAGVSGTLAIAGAYCSLPSISTLSAPGLPHEAQSLHLRYGPGVALSTLSPCRCLHEPKTRFPVGGWPLPGRESHPLDAPGLSWRTEDRLEDELRRRFNDAIPERRHS